MTFQLQALVQAGSCVELTVLGMYLKNRPPSVLSLYTPHVLSNKALDVFNIHITYRPYLLGSY
jgi:hypothetical protein